MKESNVDAMHNGLPIAKARQTSLGLYVTASEAYDLWRADPDTVRILDVRSPEEYALIGHAPMAWLIPLAVPTYVWDATGRALRWAISAEFVPTVAEWVEPGVRILVTCRSGGRSAMAINSLAGAGLLNLYNIVDGMEGELVDDPGSAFDGLRMRNGWRNAGLPWTYELDPTLMRLPTDCREPGAGPS
jgi:rhodanese-related sulfurtransferase